MKKQTKEYTKEAIKELVREANIKPLTKNKPRITLPYKGKLISEFAEEISQHIKNKNTLFYRTDSRDIVEIGRVKINDKEKYLGFLQVKPNRFITHLEEHVIPGIYIKEENEKTGEDEWVFKPKSITGDLGKTLLVSKILEDALPKIDRIFTVPIPIIYNDELTFPKRGYDKRFRSWLPSDSPEIEKPDMELKEAKEIIYNIFQEFCFQTHQDYINAIATLLTPFIRGLFTSFNVRTPVIIWLANRERAGKEFGAGIIGIVYEGHALEEPPICSGEKNSANNEELRKKILAAMISGRKRLHFANNKGFMNNAVFEGVVTASKYSDRVLGKNEILTFDNELDFSLSGNIGIGFTPDFANRARFIRLFLDIEDANSRKFNNPNLHKWVEENRGLILSALYALIRNWFEKGCKSGTIPFTSFPEWAKICGGIMEAAGYDSPCKPDKETLNISLDRETQDIKRLFELCYEKNPDEWIQKRDITNIIIHEGGELFGFLDFNEKKDQTKFGLKLKKCIGRIFSDIKLIVQDTSIRPSRWNFKFTKEFREIDKTSIFGNLGNFGNVHPLTQYKTNNNNNYIYRGAKVAKAAKVTTFSPELIKKSGLDPKLVEKVVKEVNEQ